MSQHSGTADIVDRGRPAMRVFTNKDGLPQNSIQAMAFDAKGYLWVGTQDGAARYNGRRWAAVPMPNRNLSNFVGTLMAASDGSVWFGTNGAGVARYHDGEWRVFDEASGELPDDQVRCLLEARGPKPGHVIWIGTRSGLVRVAKGKTEIFDQSSGLPNNVVRALLETTEADGSSTIWVGTREGLARFNADRWTIYDTSSGLPGNVIVALLETVSHDGERMLWVGTDGDGLACISRGEITVFDVSNGIPSNAIRCLLETRLPNGGRALWVGTGGGLARFEKGRWTTLDTSTGLPHNVIMSLLANETPNGTKSIWAGTLGGGVARIEMGGWTTVDTAAGLPANSVWSFLETRGERGGRVYWIGTLGKGLARWERGEWSVQDTTDGLPDNIIVCLHETASARGGKTIWAGTLRGIACFERGQWSIPGSNAPKNSVLTLLSSTSPDGGLVLWAGTDGVGIARYAEDQWTNVDASSGLPNNVVASLLETRGTQGEHTLWAGTNGGGLARFSRGKWMVESTKTGMPNDLVMGLGETNENGVRTLWAGTEGGGVARLDLTKPGATWKTFSENTTPALPSNIVYQIRRDRNGRVYLFTSAGVARLTRRSPSRDNPAEFTVYTFTTEDGLPSSECNAGASMVDSLGRLWAGTGDGAAIFDPAREVEDNEPKRIYIERVQVNGKSLRLSKRAPLTYDQNNLIFEVALLSYFREDDTRYRTQLVGFDRQPSEWTTDWKREYTNIPEGDYTFKVWARDYSGNVSGPATVEFRIKPAPWRTWWAYALYTGTAAGAGYGALRWRLETLRRRNELLEAKVAEQTAELATKVAELEISEARITEKATELAQTVEQLVISEQRALESEKIALDASLAKSVFLSSMSHELRTPLNAILGFVQVMERTPNRDGEDRENLATIMRSGEHLLGLINDVLSISKIEAGKITLTEQPFDLKLLLKGIEEMIRVRAQMKNLNLIVDLYPNLPQYVRGDEGKLRQVLINLLGNALKFTEAGGVSLRARRREDGAVQFEVEDTGFGIAEEEIGKLFQPFVQTASGQQSHEGTGLGLAISRSFIQLMGGDVTVRSQLGQGTVFSFHVFLPDAEQADVRSESLRAVALEVGQPVYRLLIVDDIPENRKLLQKLLAPFGFQLRLASNGREAVDIWQAWDPHLIWMDIRMAVMDGVEATAEIRRLEAERSEAASNGDGAKPPVKIVALTASAFEHDREVIMDAGCDDFVAKPYREATIFEKLTEHIGVRFRYEDMAPEGAPSASRSLEVVVPSRLAVLPSDLLSRLQATSIEGDIEEAYGVVDGIDKHDAELAGELKRLIKGFRFDEILDAIEKIEVRP